VAYEREERAVRADDQSEPPPLPPPKKRSGCLTCLGVGCGVIFVFALLVGLGVWYVASTVINLQRNAVQAQPKPIAMPDPNTRTNQARVAAFVVMLKGHEAYLRAGKTQTLELDPANLNLLLARLAAEPGSAAPNQGAAVSVEGDRLRFQACVPGPDGKGYVNLDVRGRFRVENGRMTQAELEQFRLGDAELPGLLKWLAPLVVEKVFNTPDEQVQIKDPQVRADLLWMRRALRGFAVKDGKLEVEVDGSAVNWPRYDELTGQAAGSAATPWPTGVAPDEIQLEPEPEAPATAPPPGAREEDLLHLTQ
jgi:hypothetical protein